MPKVGRKSGYQEIKGNLGFFGWAWRILLWIWVLGGLAIFAWSLNSGTFVLVAYLGVGVWGVGIFILGILVFITGRERIIVPIDPED